MIQSPYITRKAITGSSRANGQIKQYTADPNAESITPDDQDAPAIAYQKDGTGDLYTWNTTTHLWQ